MLLLGFLALAGTVSSQSPSQRNPNPCQDVTGELTFVRDWSSCSDYFWCNEDKAVPSGPCPDDKVFDEEILKCAPATEECLLCPADGTVVVADPEDLDCTSYYFCMDGVRTDERVVCSEGLRFNRVSGLCDFGDKVPCRRSDPIPEPEPEPEPECPEGERGDRNSDISCGTFIQCNNGQNDGTFSCTEGLHFNPETSSCDFPGNLDPPCVENGLEDLTRKVKVRTVETEDHPAPHKSFRERLLTKLHLNH